MVFNDPNLQIFDRFNASARAVLFPGDTLEYLKSLPSDLVRLVITSPPYNLGKEYETRVGLRSYLDTQRPIVEELCRILADDGSLCWQVGNYVEDGEVFPLDIYYYDMFKDAGLRLRNRIIWHFGHGLHASRRFSGRYETVLWFTKSDKYVFNLDPVRIDAKYPGKRHYKGPNKGKPSGNPRGKNPSDYWEDLVTTEFAEGVLDIPNVKANHPEKTPHPCQFPVELVERFVLALTKADDWVLDPYAGVGTTLVAAIRRGRKAMGAEKESDYVEITTDRIRRLMEGTLPIRPLGKPVHQPNGNEKTSRVPDEWLSLPEFKWDAGK